MIFEELVAVLCCGATEGLRVVLSSLVKKMQVRDSLICKHSFTLSYVTSGGEPFDSVQTHTRIPEQYERNDQVFSDQKENMLVFVCKSFEGSLGLI